MSNNSNGPIKIGHYEVGETIGKGRYSVVKKGMNVLTMTPVALKIVQKNKLPLSDLKVLVREMEILKFLNHPNICKLYEVFSTRSAFCLVLEYVQGDTLGNILQAKEVNKKYLAKSRKKWMYQLASAVNYCHERRVCHRDIKPDNILINQDGNLKLVDFGFSRISQDLCNTHCGTPFYAAPELFRSNAYMGPGVDVWAMGVILYSLKFYTLPFQSQNLRKEIQVGEYTLPGRASSELKILLKSMLCGSAEDRVTARDVLNSPWFSGNARYLSGNVPLPQNMMPLIETKDSRKDFDEDTITLMEYMGFTREDVYTSLSANKYDQIASIYYLLVDKAELEEYKEILFRLQNNPQYRGPGSLFGLNEQNFDSYSPYSKSDEMLNASNSSFFQGCDGTSSSAQSSSPIHCPSSAQIKLGHVGKTLSSPLSSPHTHPAASFTFSNPMASSGSGTKMMDNNIINSKGCSCTGIRYSCSQDNMCCSVPPANKKRKRTNSMHNRMLGFLGKSKSTDNSSAANNETNNYVKQNHNLDMGQGSGFYSSHPNMPLHSSNHFLHSSSSGFCCSPTKLRSPSIGRHSPNPSLTKSRKLSISEMFSNLELYQRPGLNEPSHRQRAFTSNNRTMSGGF